MIPLTRLSGIALAAVVLALLGQGCAQFPTAATRKASMSRVREITVGQTTVDRYLVDRVAMIITGDVTISPGRTPGSFGMVAKGGIGYGMATPIEADGHFITAAHCLKGGKLRLIYRKDDGRVSFATPRVIWKGTRSFDCAVLSVDDHLSRYFEWGARPAVANQVVGCGMEISKAGKFTFGVDQYAGDILHVEPLKRPEGSGLLFSENAPNHPGDSGGPVCDLNGRLLGICINIQGYLQLGSWIVRVPGIPLKTTVLRPDPAWLEQSILPGR